MTRPKLTASARRAGRVRRFFRDARGNFTALFAVTAVSLVGLVGLAIDVGRAVSTKSQLDSAADAAALAAVIETVDQLSNNAGQTSAFAAGQARGLAVFKAAVAQSVGALTSGVTISKAGSTVSAKVDYAGSVTTSLSKVANIASLPVSGTRVAQQGGADKLAYIQVNFLLDISQSMGIGGTNADVKAIKKRQNNCEFVCHQSGSDKAAVYNSKVAIDYYTTIRRDRPDIKLKIDYLNSSLDNFFGQIKTELHSSADLVWASIYTFASESTPTAFVRDVPAINLTSKPFAFDIEDSANTVHHRGSPVATVGSTRIADVLDWLATSLPKSGDGSSPANRKQYVIIVTDGVQDINGWSYYVDLDYLNQCTNLKKFATLIVVETPYPFTGDSIVNNMLYYIKKDITPTMKSCSSDPDKYYFMAPSGPDIKVIFQEVYNALSGGKAGLIPFSSNRFVRS